MADGAVAYIAAHQWFTSCDDLLSRVATTQCLYKNVAPSNCRCVLTQLSCLFLSCI